MEIKLLFSASWEMVESFIEMRCIVETCLREGWECKSDMEMLRWRSDRMQDFIDGGYIVLKSDESIDELWFGTC